MIKKRLKILDRAYDKASKFIPGQVGVLAEMESKILLNAIRQSKILAEPERIARRNAIWTHYGWDTSEGEAKWQQIREGITNGKHS